MLAAALLASAVGFNAVFVDCGGGPVPSNVSTYCQVNGAPATLCRVPDANCTAAGERVAEHLHVRSDEHTNCSTFNWTWACSDLTDAPTAAPTAAPSTSPTAAPTAAPTTATPTAAPSTAAPTATPSTVAPIAAPTALPTAPPTAAATNDDDDDGPAWHGAALWVAVAVIAACLVGCIVAGVRMWRNDRHPKIRASGGIIRFGNRRVHPNPTYASRQ